MNKLCPLIYLAALLPRTEWLLASRGQPDDQRPNRELAEQILANVRE